MGKKGSKGFNWSSRYSYTWLRLRSSGTRSTQSQQSGCNLEPCLHEDTHCAVHTCVGNPAQARNWCYSFKPTRIRARALPTTTTTPNKTKTGSF